MRRILQIGVGQTCEINFQSGDVFLGVEPMITQMRETGLWKVDIPGFVDAHFFEGVITAKELTPSVGFVIDGHIETGRISRYGDKVKALTLDELLFKYSKQGFMETIDFLYAPAWEMYPVFKEFSWCVKPDVILIPIIRDDIVDLFEEKGYNVFKRSSPHSPFLAIRNSL